MKYKIILAILLLFISFGLMIGMNNHSDKREKLLQKIYDGEWSSFVSNGVNFVTITFKY